MYAKPKKTQLIGLTGGIASGKSTVTSYLEKLGYPVIDTDVLSRKAFAMPATQTSLKKIFKTTDRDTLREIIFFSKPKKNQLEKLLHPIIWKLVEKEIKSLKARRTPPALIFVAVPLLFETKSERRYDKIVNIATTQKNQILRLTTRDKISVPLAKKILENQWPTSLKNKNSDYVLHNNRTPEELQLRVVKLLQKI